MHLLTHLRRTCVSSERNLSSTCRADNAADISMGRYRGEALPHIRAADRGTGPMAVPRAMTVKLVLPVQQD